MEVGKKRRAGGMSRVVDGGVVRKAMFSRSGVCVWKEATSYTAHSHTLMSRGAKRIGAIRENSEK